jgi:hypothetical protein
MASPKPYLTNTLNVAGFPDTYSAHGLAKAVSDEHINDLPEAFQALNSAASL